MQDFCTIKMPYAKSDSKKTQCSQRNRYLKLSLKKNKIQLEDEPKLDRSSDIIELDDSFDRLQSEFHASLQRKPKIYSPIVIDDSCELSEDLPTIEVSEKEPSRCGNVSFNCSKEVKSPTFNKESRPSIGGWSPAQHIICATPRHDPIPTTPKDTANESYEKCSINKIQQSQKKLLSDLYGETWKSIPSLFKTLSKKFDNFDGVSKKLQFDEDEKDNNIRHELKRNKELYLTGSDLKRYETNFGDSEKKSKKKLFTEKVPSTPDIRERVKSRNVNSTTKKTKIKGMSVTELVKTMNVIEDDNITNDGVRSKLTDDGVRNKLKDGIRSEFTERTKSKLTDDGLRTKMTNDSKSKLADDGVRSKLKDGIRSEFTEGTKSKMTDDSVRSKMSDDRSKLTDGIRNKLTDDGIRSKLKDGIRNKLTDGITNKLTDDGVRSKLTDGIRSKLTDGITNKLTDDGIRSKLTTEIRSELTDDISKDKVDGLMKKIEQVYVTRSGNGVNRLSFMGSLADNVPSWRCHVEAIQYRDNYKTLREQLTRRLYQEFNRAIFDDALDADMPVLWDGKLRSTAGTTTNRLTKNCKGDRIRTSSIKLSSKVVDAPQRLRDTLVHELCHAATWLVDAELRAGHGPLWKKWAAKALRVYPELGEISRCHDLQIHFKYSYKCTTCGYSIQRHSKSIDITKKCCGYCRGTFEIVINKKNKDGVVVSTPARKGNMNEFARFVKDNYAFHKEGKTHAQVMKVLSEEFSARKNNKIIGSDDSS